jgi:flagellar biosynthesis anti-sigma factor FlgM
MPVAWDADGKWCATAPHSHMKIHNDGPQPNNPVEAGRTQNAPPVGGLNGTHAGHTVSGHEGDSVEISGISQHLAESNALDAQQRESRVAQLTALYAKGHYQVDAAALSRKLVSNSIEAGEGGEK